mmetsp:Transcript_39256/g.83626  ORF Transcript_39256/g.83626 Transcript_39256/m.83626 type:complete len:330 (-) Transcript_39256:89-1078(-)
MQRESSSQRSLFEDTTGQHPDLDWHQQQQQQQSLAENAPTAPPSPLRSLSPSPSNATCRLCSGRSPMSAAEKRDASTSVGASLAAMPPIKWNSLPHSSLTSGLGRDAAGTTSLSSNSSMISNAVALANAASASSSSAVVRRSNDSSSNDSQRRSRLDAPQQGNEQKSGNDVDFRQSTSSRRTEETHCSTQLEKETWSTQDLSKNPAANEGCEEVGAGAPAASSTLTSDKVAKHERSTLKASESPGVRSHVTRPKLASPSPISTLLWTPTRPSIGAYGGTPPSSATTTRLAASPSAYDGVPRIIRPASLSSIGSASSAVSDDEEDYDSDA